MSKNKTETASVPKLAVITSKLHDVFKRRGSDVIEAGRLLLQAKKELGHGKFLTWVGKEFSLSEKTAQRYMSAHKFIIEVAEPLLKSDKLSDLRLHPSAIYKLIDAQESGTLDGYPVKQADVEAILKEAVQNWIGSKRLIEILQNRHPVEATVEATGEAQPHAADDLTGAPVTGEPAGMATSAEPAGEVTGEAMSGEATDTAASTEPAGGARDGKGEQSTETPPNNPPPSAKDERNLASFTAGILSLKQLVAGSATKYVATAVQTADLETVADFVRAVADLKKKLSAETSISAEASAEARKAHYAEAEAA